MVKCVSTKVEHILLVFLYHSAEDQVCISVPVEDQVCISVPVEGSTEGVPLSVVMCLNYHHRWCLRPSDIPTC